MVLSVSRSRLSAERLTWQCWTTKFGIDLKLKLQEKTVSDEEREKLSEPKGSGDNLSRNRSSKDGRQLFRKTHTDLGISFFGV